MPREKWITTAYVCSLVLNMSFLQDRLNMALKVRTYDESLNMQKISSSVEKKKQQNSKYETMVSPFRLSSS